MILNVNCHFVNFNFFYLFVSKPFLNALFQHFSLSPVKEVSYFDGFPITVSVITDINSFKENCLNILKDFCSTALLEVNDCAIFFDLLQTRNPLRFAEATTLDFIIGPNSRTNSP